MVTQFTRPNMGARVIESRSCSKIRETIIPWVCCPYSSAQCLKQWFSTMNDPPKTLISKYFFRTRHKLFLRVNCFSKLKDYTIPLLGSSSIGIQLNNGGTLYKIVWTIGIWGTSAKNHSKVKKVILFSTLKHWYNLVLVFIPLRFSRNRNMIQILL